MGVKFNPFSSTLDVVDSPSGDFADVELNQGTAAAPSISFNGDPNTGIYSPGADQVAISTGGTGRLFVDSSGRVGVGTGSPSSKLHIEDGNNTVVTLGNTSYDNGVIQYFNGSLLLKAGASTGDKTFQVYTSNTERLRITSDGKLGVGTSSPSEKLTVSGNGNFSGAFIGTRDTGSNLIYNVFGNTPGSSYSVPRGIEFNVGSGAGVTTAAVIDSSGRVGIGTTPGQILDVQASGAAIARIKGGSGSGQSASFFVTSAGSTSTLAAFGDRATAFGGTVDQAVSIYTTTGVPLTFDVGGAEKARLDSSGRLLVGTSTARSNVFVSTTNFTPKVQIENAGNNYAGLSLLNYSASGYAPTLTFGLSGSDTAGTNTATPASFLLGRINFTGNDGTEFKSGALIEARNDQVSAWSAGDCPTRLVFSTTADSASSPTERMRIDSSGNVGIGTASPDKNLVVNQANPGGDVGIRIKNNTGTDAGTTASLRFTTSTGDFDTAALIADRATNSLRYEYGGNERLRVTNDGKLLVGTSTARAVGSSGIPQNILCEHSSIATSAGFVRNTNDESGATVVLGKSRGTSAGGTTIVQSGDVLGEVRFTGADGVDLETPAGSIRAEVDGTPGANDMPGRLVFSTTADGSSSPTARATIDSAGRLLVGTSTAGNGGTLSVNGTSSVGGGSTGTQNSMSKVGMERTSSVTTSAKTIFTSVIQGLSSAAAAHIIVYGNNDAGAGFLDVVAAKSGGTVAVISSSTIEGSPAARTYTMSGADLQLQMASGTYNTNVRCTSMGYPF